MGAWGFDTFKELLKQRAGLRGDLDSLGTSSLNYYGIWVNNAYRQLCTQNNVLGLKKNLYFPELFTSTTATTTDGTAYVSTPASTLYITEVFDTTNGRKLDWIPWKKYIEYTDRTDTDKEGDATEWVRYGSRIYLHPTPSTTGDTLTIYYKKLVADLASADPTIIGAEWDEPILELAAYKMFSAIAEYEKAKFSKEAFLEMAAGLADVNRKDEKDTNESWGVSLAYINK